MNFLLTLPDDALSCILRHAPLPTLCRLRSTCHVADKYVAQELEHRYRTLLSPTIDDSSAFRNELTITGAVISGSGALLVAGDRDFRPADLDVYVPSANLFHVVGYLLAMERYQITTLRSPRYHSNGVAGVLTLRRGSSSIDIVQSVGDCATLPILHFWSTAVMTSLGGNSLCIPYPKLLENGRALLSTTAAEIPLASNPEHPLLSKYRALGFQFRATDVEWRQEDNNVPHCTQDRSPYCPNTTRWMGDSFCINVHLGNITERMQALPDDPRGWTTVWWRGGTPCEGACTEGLDYIKPGIYGQLRDAVS